MERATREIAALAASFSSAIGGFVSGAWLLGSVFPELSWLLSFIPVSGAVLAVAHFTVGVVYAAVGYLLAKVPTPVPPEKRDRRTAILAILAAVTIILSSYGLFLALDLSLAGLLLTAAETPQRRGAVRGEREGSDREQPFCTEVLVLPCSRWR